MIKHIFTVLLFLGLSNIVAQSHFSKTVSKEDGRFISGRVDASEFSIRKFDNTGLVKEIHLNIELWTLMGEPVEMYLFRWIRGSSVTASDYTVLSEGSLSKYPDLLKRFNNLKPKNVELRYYVSTELKPEYVSKKDLDVSGEKFINNLQITKNASWGSNGGATGHRDINWRVHLFTDKAGETGSELVPSSPKDWLHFIDWGDPGSTNKRAYNTFKYAGKMTFYGVEVTKMEPPMREIDAIAKEYRKRENGEEEKEEEEEEKEAEEMEEEEIGEDGDKKSDEDFWSGEKSESNNGKEDDFWSGENQDNSDLDFWSGQGTSAEEVAVQKSVAIATGNQFIGEETVTTRMVTIYYHDHGKIDGDRVNIFHNGKKIVSNVTLKGYEKSIDVELNDGVNRISFEALNMGSSGNNTASFTIKDSNGKQLYSNNWSIDTGYKGTLLLIKI